MSDLRLRAFTADDLEFLDRLDSDPAALGPFEWQGFSDARGRRRLWQENGLVGPEATCLAIVLGDGTVPGIVTWRTVKRGGPSGVCLEIGVALLPEHRGRGVGTVAHRLLVDHLFGYTTVHRLEALTDVENLAEQRVLEVLGFQPEGVIREPVWQAGRWRDLVMYSRLRSDAEAGVGALGPDG